MIIYGLDPGFSGAWGAIDHNGNYKGCGDMLHTDKHIRTNEVFEEMLAVRGKEDCEVVVESVHSMPQQGVHSVFKFGVAFGGALSLAERMRCPWHLVTPQVWKKSFGLTADKHASSIMARKLWPDAPLARQKDNGRAEALLMAYWLMKQHGND